MYVGTTLQYLSGIIPCLIVNSCNFQELQDSLQRTGHDALLLKILLYRSCHFDQPGKQGHKCTCTLSQCTGMVHTCQHTNMQMCTRTHTQTQLTFTSMLSPFSRVTNEKSPDLAASNRAGETTSCCRLQRSAQSQ